MFIGGIPDIIVTPDGGQSPRWLADRELIHIQTEKQNRETEYSRKMNKGSSAPSQASNMNHIHHYR